MTTRAAIEEQQLASLRDLVGLLAAHNPFYAPALRSAGLADEVPSLAAFSARLPTTTKQAVMADQAASPPYGTNLTYALHEYSRFNQTSGTTGQPMRWLDTPASWQWMLDNWKVVYQAAGVDRVDRVLFAFSFGPFLGFWTAYEAAAQVGCMCIPAGGMGSPARLRALFDNRATVLCCTPTYAMRLAEVAAEEGVDLGQAPVRTLIVAGETGGSIPATRERVERLWPTARVFDHHGMTEVGPVSFQCPAEPGVLHVVEASYYPEVVDPETGKPVEADGEATGELVLTTLGRTGSPLLRYRTGDLVRPRIQEPCACGHSEIALVGGILGRTDDMVVVRGVNVYPSAVDQIVRAREGVAEYRVELQRTGSMTEMRILVEPRADVSDGDRLARDLAGDLRTGLALRVDVQPVPADSLPRFEMKAKRWVWV